MKHSKIIFGDGTVQRGVFADSAHAREYAQREARRMGTIVRSQSVVAGNTLIDAAVYRQIGVRT